MLPDMGDLGKILFGAALASIAMAVGFKLR